MVHHNKLFTELIDAKKKTCNVSSTSIQSETMCKNVVDLKSHCLTMSLALQKIRDLHHFCINILNYDTISQS